MKLDPIAVTLMQCGKHFDGQCVLQPLDLTIGAGETVVLLGPSGCGKTTTLRMIAGLERPDTGGRVRFDARDVTALPIEKRQVGMVFQHYALFPHLNVHANVAYGLRIRGVAREEIRSRVDALLALTELQAHAHKSIDALSGGQKQRVALARALAPQPRILLLDEPLTALDARLRDTLRTEMNSLLRGLGVTTVYVTHDQAEAMALADRIVVMSKGRVEQIGTPREIYHAPANRSVAGFIGTMNRLSARVCEDGLEIDGRRLPRALLREGTTTPATGASLEAFFRPEDAFLSAPGDAHLRARVASAAFLGERTRVQLECAGGTWVVVVPGHETITPGSEAGLRLRDAALMLLD